MRLKLVKQIDKEGDIITQKNILYIDGELISEVNWEEIDSFYSINGIKYICPKGPYFMHIYNNTKLEIFKPDNFKLNKEWELKCFYHEKEYFLFNFFLSKGESDCKLYVFRLDSYKWYSPSIFNYHTMYDFIWTTNSADEHIYPLTGIIFDYNLLIQSFLFTVKGSTENITLNDNRKRNILDTFDYTNKIGYFDIYLEVDIIMELIK